MKLTIQEILIRAVEMHFDTAQQEIELTEEVLKEFANKLWRGPMFYLQTNANYWHDIPVVKKDQIEKFKPIKLKSDAAPSLDVKKEKFRETWEKFLPKKVPELPGELPAERLARARSKIEEDWFRLFCKSDPASAAIIGSTPQITDDFKVMLIDGSHPKSYWDNFLRTSVVPPAMNEETDKDNE